MKRGLYNDRSAHVCKETWLISNVVRQMWTGAALRKEVGIDMWNLAVFESVNCDSHAFEHFVERSRPNKASLGLV